MREATPLRVSLPGRRAASVAEVRVSGDDVPFIIFTETSVVHAQRSEKLARYADRARRTSRVFRASRSAWR